MILKAKIREITEEKFGPEDENLISLNIDEDDLSSMEGYSEISLTTSYGLEKRFLISDNDLYILSKVIITKLDGTKNNDN